MRYYSYAYKLAFKRTKITDYEPQISSGNTIILNVHIYIKLGKNKKLNLSRGDKFPDFIFNFRSFSVEISGEMEGGGVGRMGKQRVLILCVYVGCCRLEWGRS